MSAASLSRSLLPAKSDEADAVPDHSGGGLDIAVHIENLSDFCLSPRLPARVAQHCCQTQNVFPDITRGDFIRVAVKYRFGDESAQEQLGVCPNQRVFKVL